jgi:hypothetical protein
VTSPSQRPLPDNTQQSQETTIHAPGGIRTHNPSKRAAVNPRLMVKKKESLLVSASAERQNEQKLHNRNEHEKLIFRYFLSFRCSCIEESLNILQICYTSMLEARGHSSYEQEQNVLESSVHLCRGKFTPHIHIRTLVRTVILARVLSQYNSTSRPMSEEDFKFITRICTEIVTSKCLSKATR